MKHFPSKRNAQEMLEALGMKSLDELFADIPEEVRVDGLNLPEGMSEMALSRAMEHTLAQNVDSLSFLGGGVYRHFVPAAVRAILSRSEFYTAYTPYQPEISQGVLQAFFEYQCFIAELTGMPVSNVSLYDASSAAAEALLMSARVNRKAKNVVVSGALPSHKKSVIQNYLKGAELEIRWLNIEKETGCVNLARLGELVDKETAGVYVENPNYFGILDGNVLKVKDVLKELNPKTLLILGVNPLTLFAVTPPGSYGADIVVGEGQVFGNAPSYGGPLLGLFATVEKKKLLFQMPGRVIGITKDSRGERGFTMTLQSREQHIKREKASSNICSNQGLCTLAAVVHLAVMGKTGLMELAKQNMENARYLASEIEKLEGFLLPFGASPVFNEFVVRSEKTDIKELNRKGREAGILPGIALVDHFPKMEKDFLVTTTEVHTKEELDRFVAFLKSA